MPIRLSLAALSIVLLSGALMAQEYAGFPEERVRQIRGDNFFPDEIYPQNRVIIRNTFVQQTTYGMQISGEVVTDFDANRVPSGETIPTGQLMGIRVNVELYSYDAVLERDPATNKVIEPKIDPKKEGNLVAGQILTVSVNETFGRYGLARFKLPALAKPLAPGLYRLVARVRMKSQEAGIQRSFKWCSDMYGSRSEVDPDTNEVFFKEVMVNPDIHEEVYRDLMDSIGEINDVSLIWVGAVLQNGMLEMISPEESTERRPANYLVWSYHMTVIGQLVDYEYQLKNVDQMVDEDLERKLALDGATEEMRENWKKEAAEDKKRIRTQNTELIAQNGGPTSTAERKIYTTNLAVKTAVMEQVARFQEYLTQRYWCLTDGWLQYRGWHTVNAPGYAIWEAVTKKDNVSGRIARIEKLQEARDADGGISGRWERRKEAWKYYPAELSKLAFDYLRTKEEKDVWDADKFTEKDGTDILMDPAKWAEYRSEFILNYLEETDKIFAQVTTTNAYAVQVWPQALATAKAARDDVMSLTYSWEYYVRVDILKEEKEPILEAWKREDQAMPTLDLSKYYKRGTTAPGVLKTRFDGNLSQVKSEVKVGDFVATYRRAIDQEVEAKNLPGARPPSAPTQD